MSKERIFELSQNTIYEVLPDLEGEQLSQEDRLVDLGRIQWTAPKLSR